MNREEEITRLRQRLAELEVETPAAEVPTAVPGPSSGPLAVSSSIPPTVSPVTPPQLPKPVPPRLPEDGSRNIFQSAESWLAWTGVGLLVIGLLLFLKFSADFGWITPGMQVCAAAVCCCGLIVWGNFVAEKRRGLGGLIFGGGVAGLFGLILASDVHFHFIGHGTAFFFTLVTATICFWQAVRRESEALCLMAVAGGFAAPMFFMGEYQFDSLIAVFPAIILTCGLACYLRYGWWIVLLVSALGAWTFLLVPVLVHNASSAVLVPLGFSWDPAPVDRQVLQPAIAWSWLALWLAPVGRALTEPEPNSRGTHFRVWVTAFPAGVAGLAATGLLWKVTTLTNWGWMALAIAPVYLVAGVILRGAAPGKPWLSSAQLATGILFLALCIRLLLSGRESGIVFGVVSLGLHWSCRLAKDKTPAAAAHIVSLATAAALAWLVVCVGTSLEGHRTEDLFTALFLVAVLLAVPWLNPPGTANPLYRIAGHVALFCLILGEGAESDLSVDTGILLTSGLAFVSYFGLLSGRHPELRATAHGIFALLLPVIVIRICETSGLSVATACVTGAMACALFVALASASRTCRLIYLWTLHVLFLLLFCVQLSNMEGGVLISPALAVYAVVLMLIGVRRKSTAVRSAGVSVIVILLLRLFFVDLAQISPAGKTLVFLGVGAFLLAASYFLPRALSRKG